MARKKLAPVCSVTPRLTPEEQARVPYYDTSLLAEHLAVVNGKHWGDKADVTVGFLEPTSLEMRNKILAYANKWGQANGGGNVVFRWSQTSPMVRITFAQQGYWSYLGRDILGIAPGKATMCFEKFTMSTRESEWNRVVPHEFGHTLGFPHEHMRAAIIAKLDRAKTIAYFMANQGWSQQEVVAQVLTPISEASIRGTPQADVNSVMCYDLPAEITVDGVAIPGGQGLDPLDLEFVKTIYAPVGGPVVNPPPPPPPPPAGGAFTTRVSLDVTVDPVSKAVTVKQAA